MEENWRMLEDWESPNLAAIMARGPVREVCQWHPGMTEEERSEIPHDPRFSEVWYRILVRSSTNDIRRNPARGRNRRALIEARMEEYENYIGDAIWLAETGRPMEEGRGLPLF
jgi:hypothetical protein